jgi:hypothetical protein
MTLLGHVRNGKIELDDPGPLPEGARVRIDILGGEPAAVDGAEGALAEKLLKYAGRIKDAPDDLARNHDHYIHGTPKE